MKFKIKEKLDFIRENRQIVYSIILMIIIPVALVANTYFAVQSMQKNMDQELRSKAISVANVFNVSISKSLGNYSEIQSNIDEFTKSNDTIKGLDVYIPFEENFKKVASLDKSSINEVSEDLINVMAWHEEQPVAKLIKVGKDKEVSGRFIGENERFWNIIAPLKDRNGDKKAIVSILVSLKDVDSLTFNTLVQSFTLLVFTVVIIVLLLMSNVRLFEYAILFRKLKEVDQMKDDFISIASHELKTPLTAIKGYSSFLVDQYKNKSKVNKEEIAKRIISTADRLGELVSDVLDVSRIEQGRMKMDFVPVNVTDLLAETIEELKVQADDKKLKTVFKKDPNIPRVLADPAKLKQVFVNLISNAIKYTNKGEITISIEQEEKKVNIFIRDTGIGMSAEEKKNLFTKFYRVRNKETNDIAGTGLGLWITKQLIEKMSGSIYIDSIKGSGSQFTISLPFLKPRGK